MGWLLLFLTISLVVLIPINIFIARQIYKCDFIKKIKNKYLKIAVSLLFFYITIILYIIDFVNANIIMIHFFFVLAFTKLIYMLLCMWKKKPKLKLGQEITIVVSIIITAIYLSYGYYVAHNVVETHYEIISKKDLGVDSFRIVQITDSHVGATMDGDQFYDYMLEINKTNPDIVVVTGDYVDDDTSLEDMKKACEGLGALKTKYGVYFAYGNHDKGYFDYRGYNNEDLKIELAKNDVTILEDEGLDIVGNIYLFGRRDKHEKNRQSADYFMKNIDQNKYVIVLDHQPNDYKNESEANIDLVISGHTHGGQVFPLQIVDKIFGANNQIYGIEERKNTTFIVSSGIGDWRVKFKTGALAEYVVIDIKNK